MELKKKDYKFINNTGKLPGFAEGNVPTGYESSFAIDKQTGYPSSANNYGNQVDTSILPKQGTANITKSINNYTSVPANVDVRPEGKPLSTTNPSGSFTNGAGAASGAGPGFAIGGWLGGGVVNGIDRIYNKYDAGTLLSEAGSQQSSVGGINYTRQNTVDAHSIIKKYQNEGRMDWWSSPGSAIAAIAGYGRAREQAKLAETKSINLANAQTGSALTKAMRLNYSKEHGDSSTQSLYGAKDGIVPVNNINSSGLFMMNDKNTDLLFKARNGKLPKYTDGSPAVDSKTGLTKKNYLLDTAYGEIYGKANALGQPGEIITDTKTGATNEIGSGLPRHSGDIIPIFADKDTAILTDNWIDPVTKKTYAQAAKDGDDSIPNLIDRMAMYVKPSKQTKTAKNGKLPKLAEGGWGNAITSGIGVLTGLGQMISAAMNKPYRPNTYVGNPYELNALDTLAGLQVNPYPIIQEMRRAESRTNRAIDRSGGLSTAQRGLGRLSALYGTQSNIANTLAGIQQQNNTYKANYAQAALNVGANNAQRRMAANQWDLDYFSKAHAARLGGVQTGMQNMLAQSQNWYKNDFKRRQFNDTMALYKQEQINTAAANEAMRKYNQQVLDMQKQQYMSDDYLRQLIAQRGRRLANNV